MIDGKPYLDTALKGDAALSAKLPPERIFDGEAVFSGQPVYPYLTYAEISNTEAAHADDSESGSAITFRLNVWNPSGTGEIAIHIDRVLKSVGFNRNYANDMDERMDSGKMIRRKVMSYTKTFEIT